MSNQPVPVSGEDQPAKVEYENVCHRDVMEDWGQHAAPAPRGEDQPDPRTGILGLILDRLDDDGTFTVGFVLGELDSADRAAGIRRVTGQQITEHLAAEQERLGQRSGNNEHWHGGMQSAADAVREFFEGGY